MLSNWEEEEGGKMFVFSSTTNEWPQSQTIDEKISFMTPTSGFLMKKAATNQEQQQQQHPSQLHGLRCPRCDSSNTKFCYYNNYSLSQPRHFCKACKRYWTRGGTLRNVPVGGGCRKNKRAKKQPSTSVEAITVSTSTTANANPNPTTAAATSSSRAQMDMISSGPSQLNPLFFGLPTNPSEMNLHGYDLQPQLNSLGLGFSSTPTDGLSSNLLFGPSYSSPTMATLLASSFHQQHKFVAKGDSNKSPFDQFQTLTGEQPLDESENFFKGVKVENGQNRQMDWSLSYHQEEHHHQFGFSSDPNSLYWGNGGGNNPSNNSVGGWHDPANVGPSVTSLI